MPRSGTERPVSLSMTLLVDLTRHRRGKPLHTPRQCLPPSSMRGLGCVRCGIVDLFIGITRNNHSTALTIKQSSKPRNHPPPLPSFAQPRNISFGQTLLNLHKSGPSSSSASTTDTLVSRESSQAQQDLTNLINRLCHHRHSDHCQAQRRRHLPARAPFLTSSSKHPR